MIWQLFLFVSLLTTCAKGKLTNSRDEYLNIYGVSHTQLSSGDHSYLIGRAIDEKGTPVTDAEVYLRSLEGSESSRPFNTRTNKKGGFYLKDLPPDQYRLFIITRDVGLNMEVTIEDGEHYEIPAAVVTDLVKVTGRIDLNRKVIEPKSFLSVMNSPFSTTTDDEGYYTLLLPKGRYVFRAAKDTFIPYVSDEREVDQSVVLDFVLEPNPEPSGLVSIRNGEGTIVRGLKTDLAIETVSGVSEMKISSASKDVKRVTNITLDEWIPVANAISLDHASEGFTTLMFEFRDAYNSKSDPVYVRYFNTNLDSSWKFVQGKIDQEIIFKKGDKIALLSDPLLTSDNSGTIPNVATVFSKPVIIEPGTEIIGGAEFRGDLIINATPTTTDKVNWTGGSAQGFSSLVRLNGKYVSMDNLNAKNIVYEISNPLKLRQDIVIKNSELNDFSVRLRYEISENFSDQDIDFRFDIDHSILREGDLDFGCKLSEGASTAQEPKARNQELRTELIYNELYKVQIKLNCVKLQVQKFSSHLTPRCNNFYDLKPNTYYFHSDISQSEIGSSGALPSTDLIDYNDPGPNYFMEPMKVAFVHGTVDSPQKTFSPFVGAIEEERIGLNCK